MKNILLTTLFTGLLFTGNVSMAMVNSQQESADKTPKATSMTLPKTVKEIEEKAQNKAKKVTQEATDKLFEKDLTKIGGTEIIDEMVQSKLETQMMVLASDAKVENCWAWDACIERHREDEAGYDSYAFN